MEQSLPPDAVHVWYTLAPRPLAEEAVATYLALLTPEERARYERFRFEKDRRQSLLGKVLVRNVLSRYLPMPPEAWRFSATGNGKPILANSPSSWVPRFNLAHTEGLVACAFARDLEVGIDVENRERAVNLDVARRFFAPAEVAYLEQAPEQRRERIFLLFWTLKEAYIKARGMGLSLPLEQFAFTLGDPPRISFEPAMKDDPASWGFFLPQVPSPVHQVAVAVQCERDVRIELLEMDL